MLVGSSGACWARCIRDQDLLPGYRSWSWAVQHCSPWTISGRAWYPRERRGAGSIATERSEAFLGEQELAAAVRIEEELRRLHPIGRVGLLLDAASFINGATVPVDGGPSILGRIRGAQPGP
jgi:hypothetical protein